MELYKQTEDIDVIGIHVTTFPNGIKEAFGSLMKTLGNDRAYYGISWMDENKNVQYYAMAEAISKDEGKQYNYELLTIEKGEYQAETIHNWMSKTDRIKDVFHDLMVNNKTDKNDPCPDKNRPCIEWYKSDEEMLCMVKTL
jgi:hypothetical protein